MPDKKGNENLVSNDHSKRVERHSKRVERHSKRVERHSKRVGEVTKRLTDVSRRPAELKLLYYAVVCIPNIWTDDRYDNYLAIPLILIKKTGDLSYHSRAVTINVIFAI
jgi:hypothetical protein